MSVREISKWIKKPIMYGMTSHYKSHMPTLEPGIGLTLGNKGNQTFSTEQTFPDICGFGNRISRLSSSKGSRPGRKGAC